MLIPFPIALWIFSLISDLIYGMGWGGIVWKETAFYTMAGGIIGALAAAIPGYLDYRTTTVPAIQKIGGWHMRINLFLVVLFSINLWLRTSSEPGAALPVILSVVGVAMLAVSGWLGGEMVYVHGAAVEPQKETASLKERDRAA
jgi:uncharacterized membrane protein